MAYFGPGISAAASALSSVYAPTRVNIDWGDAQSVLNGGQQYPTSFPGWGGGQQPMPPMQPMPSQGSSMITQMMSSLLPLIMQLITALKSPGAISTPTPTPGPSPTPGPAPVPTPASTGWTVPDFNRAIEYADVNNDNVASIDELYDFADNGATPGSLGLANSAQSQQQIKYARQAATAMLRQYDFFSNNDPTADVVAEGITKAGVARVARLDGNSQNITTYELHGITDPAAENEAITQWLDYYGLNEYGDEDGTNYAGGSPLFDETIGLNTFKDARDYLLYQFPDRPWLAEFGDIPVDDPPVDDLPPNDDLVFPDDFFWDEPEDV